MGIFDSDNEKGAMDELFGDFFDINGDGKTSFDEEYLAYMMCEDMTNDDPYENIGNGFQSVGSYSNRNHAKKEGKNLFLWILGWLFIFPLPVTILLNRGEPSLFKIILISIAWVTYLIAIFQSLLT